MADRSQVHEQILEWNGERTPNRPGPQRLQRIEGTYGELRKQNGAPTLLGSSLLLHALRGVLFIVLLRAPATLGDCNDLQSATV